MNGIEKKLNLNDTVQVLVNVLGNACKYIIGPLLFFTEFVQFSCQDYAVIIKKNAFPSYSVPDCVRISDVYTTILKYFVACVKENVGVCTVKQATIYSPQTPANSLFIKPHWVFRSCLVSCSVVG